MSNLGGKRSWHGRRCCDEGRPTEGVIHGAQFKYEWACLPRDRRFRVEAIPQTRLRIIITSISSSRQQHTMLSSTLLILTPFALGAFAQSSSSSLPFPTAAETASSNANSSSAAGRTLTLFVDAAGTDQGFAGSVVDANPCETTIAMRCTAGTYALGQSDVTCDGAEEEVSPTRRSGSIPGRNLPTNEAALFLQGTFTYHGSTGLGLSTIIATASLGVEAQADITQACDLEPTSSASCSVLIKASVDGDKDQDRFRVSYTGVEAEGKWFQVPITAGAEKLPAEGATCTAEGNAAAPTGMAGLYKVVAVPGAAALFAGAAVAL